MMITTLPHWASAILPAQCTAKALGYGVEQAMSSSMAADPVWRGREGYLPLERLLPLTPDARRLLDGVLGKY